MKRFVIIALIIASFFIINNLIRSIYNFWHKQDLLVKAQQELVQEKKEKEGLMRELKKVKDPSFIEQEAREKLFLVKPGEQVVLMPTDDIKQTTQSAGRPKKKEENWKQWVKLFFSR